MAVGTRVKGITIEFDGDTTKLGNALKKVEKEAAGIDKSLKQVNTALKFNPKNAELMAQKQQLLTQKIDATKQKLEALKRTQAQLDDDPAVDKTSQDYMELRREIITTESKLQHFEGELKKANNAKFTQLGNSFKSVGQKMSAIGSTMTTYVTGPIVAGYTLAAKSASDYEENLNKLDVAFGENAKSVTKWAQNAGKQFGLSKVQATGAASAFGALAKGIGFSEKDAAGMSTTLAGLSADLGSYFNVGVDESSKALEGIFTGESEALKKFGVVMTDTNLKQFAEDQGLVYSALSQTEKTQLRYNYVLAMTKDAQGDFSRTSSGTANSIKIFQSAISDLATAIGTSLLPIVTPIVQKITSWVQKFNELSPATQKVITIIGLVVAAIGPLVLIIGKIVTGIGALIGFIPTLLSPIGLVIAAVAAAIAIGVLIVKNWQKIKAMAIKIWTAIKNFFVNIWKGIKTAVVGYLNFIKAYFTTIWTGIKLVATKIWTGIKTAVLTPIRAIKNFAVSAFNGLKSTISKIWNGIKTAITHPIQTAKAVIKKIIDKIKGFFSFDFELPKIKLPHFSITPKGWKFKDLLKGKIPKLGIEWYAKGGVFNDPSVIGVGEAGPEAVVPLNKFWEKLDAIAANNSPMVVNVYGSDNMSVDELATAVQQKIIQAQKRRTMAWQ